MGTTLKIRRDRPALPACAPTSDDVAVRRLLQRPSDSVLWLLPVGLGLATAAAQGLGVPQVVWIGMGCVAGVCFVSSAVLHLRPSVSAPAAIDAGDLALSLQGEVEEASDCVGLALERGWWWLPSEASPQQVWEARKGELRSFGGHFHKPVRDAYRKMEQHNREASQREAAEYQAVGGELVEPGRDLSEQDRIALEGTRGVIAHALDRLAELESPTANADDGLFVTEKHKADLDTMLQEALRAVEAGNARPDGDRLFREMFVAHFADLDERLTEWDRATERHASAFGKLQAEFSRELEERELNQAPYDEAKLVQGLAVITRERALMGRLDDPLPVAFGAPTAIWRGWVSDHVMAGEVDFNPISSTAQGTILHMEGDEFSQGEFVTRIHDLLRPVHALLTEAQTWDEAVQIRLARDALQAFPKDDLCEALKKVQFRPRIPIAAGCHGC